MRRLTTFLVLVAAVLLGCGGPAETPEPAAPGAAEVAPPEVSDAAALDAFITATMDEQRIPGLAAAVVKDGGVAWTAGYGHADLDAGVAMTPDTLLNIGSVSKTITNAAVLQLWQDGRLDLDADVNRHLPFMVRHPGQPEVPITARQLLTHTAAIHDGSAYTESYACGDPAVPLGDWVEGYLVPGGAYYREGESWLETAPGEKYGYSNVGYGLLGHLVETISGQPFADYTREHVFAPLGMDETSWYLADLDLARHAVPYDYLAHGETSENPLLRGLEVGETVTETGYVGHCLYSFHNYPDGLLRTSVRQLARFLLAHMGDGSYDGGRVLEPATVEEIWKTQLERERLGRESVQGLTWRSRLLPDLGWIWGHSGGDPGVSTYMLFHPDEDAGVIVFANRATRLGPIAERLFEAAAFL